jgi:hypothetical protein
VFEKPDRRNVAASSERVSQLESQHLIMQSHIIGIQSSVERILTLVENSRPPPPPMVHTDRSPEESDGDVFPPLPGFAPPPYKYARYGIVPSTAASDDEDDATLPSDLINAPIEALQGLAKVATENAGAREPTHLKWVISL